MYRKQMLAFIAISIATLGFGQNFSQKVDSIYNFKVGDLKPDVLTKKLKEIDGFWQEMNADKSQFLPLVRKELAVAGHASYFYFDMASFVGLYSDKKQDEELVSNALGFIEWSDLNEWEFAHQLKGFANDGIFIYPSISKLLQRDKVKITNPESKEVFNQGKLLAYILLSSTNESDIQALIKEYPTLKPEAQRSVLTLLYLLNYADGNKQLAQMAKQTKDIDVRAYAQRLNKVSTLSEEDKKYVSDALAKEGEEQLQTLIELRFYAISNWSADSWNILIASTKMLRGLGKEFLKFKDVIGVR